MKLISVQLVQDHCLNGALGESALECQGVDLITDYRTACHKKSKFGGLSCMMFDVPAVRRRVAGRGGRVFYCDFATVYWFKYCSY
jgi:hypothetical protein